MKHVLVPSDFSENAFNALTCAMRYLSNDHVHFSIVHVYKKSHEDEPMVFNGKLDRLLGRLSRLERVSHHTFETCLLEGDLLTRINELVATENVDFIVMGTQGRTANRRVSFGSNTLKVINAVACPVMAVPPDFTYKEPKQILWPSRLQHAYKDRELDVLHDMTVQHHATIQLLHITDTDETNKSQQEVRNSIESRFRESEIIYHHHNARQAHTVIHNYINNFINENNIDLLVLVNSKNSFLESYLQRSTIESLGLDLNIPFFIFQNISR